MRSREDVEKERDRCLEEIAKAAVTRDPWARAFMAGAVTALDWVLESAQTYRQRPSTFTGGTPEDP